MNKKNQMIIGAFILTLSGLFCRFAGFFYRIFLSHQLGAEGMGIYHLVFPAYGICMALCCSSIQTALSRFIAGETAMTSNSAEVSGKGPRKISAPKKSSEINRNFGCKNRRTYFLCALILSLGLALCSALALYLFADVIALYLLGEVRCAPLLQVMALAVPVCAGHACIVGYYYGLQKTNVPALAQIIEQIARMGAVFLIYQVVRLRGQEFQVIHAVYGLVIGEIVSLIFCLLSFGPLMAKERPCEGVGAPFSSCMRKLLYLAIPMTANRLILSLMQSGEAVLIPSRLKLFGMEQNEALALFGTLTGMALPFIMFPSTLINSLAVMLLPEVARAQAADNKNRIRHTSNLSIQLSLFLGILCLGVFSFFGEALGVVVFESETAGKFITQMSFLCPFLYLSVTLGSIINGLGKTNVTFLHSLISLGIRLAVIIFVMPRLGITAYFYGLLASEILLTGLHLGFLHRTFGLRLDLYETVLKPALVLLPVCFTTAILQNFIEAKRNLPEIAGYLLAGVWFVCSFLLLSYLWYSPEETDQ